MNVTIKDIARRLNINYSSVSRALNNKPGVSNETRTLVVKTAKEMGYRPNSLAQSLVNRSSKTIGLILPEILNPLFGQIATGVLETAAEGEYTVLLCITNWDSMKEAGYLRMFQEKRVDGIIIKPADDSEFALLESVNVPIIGFENWPSMRGYSFVGADNEKGGIWRRIIFSAADTKLLPF